MKPLRFHNKYCLLAGLLLSLQPMVQGQVWNLVWEDNFNRSLLNQEMWNIETGTGVNGDWGTGQLDRATGREENISFADEVPGAEDGCLVITTRDEFYMDRSYTSGRIHSAGKASWGPGHRIAARVFPRDVKYQGQGFAFWMMPDEIPDGWEYIMWPQGGEIDIMEYVGAIPFHNLGSVHYAWFWRNNEWVDWNHNHQGAYYSYQHEEVPDPPEPGYGNFPPGEDDPYSGSHGFHTYGIDWYYDRIEFFVDSTVYHIHYLEDGGAFAKDGQDGFVITRSGGKRIAKSEYSHHFAEWAPFAHKMYVVLSAGVGGSQYTYGGTIVPEAVFPCSVFIDWVRVYELDATAMNEREGTKGVRIYPNPAAHTLHIQGLEPGEYGLRIVDLAGRTLINTFLPQSAEIDVSDLDPGLYLVMIAKGGRTFSKTLVIQY